MKLQDVITEPYGTTTPTTCVFYTKTGLQPVKSFSTASFSAGNAASFPHDLSRIFRCSFLSLSCLLDMQPDVGCSIGRKPWRRGWEFKWTLLRNNIAFSLSLLSNVCVCIALSLSLTHTHTHTHAHTDVSNDEVWQEIHRMPSLLADAPYKLYVTRSNNF
jgi:hypothetical protein